MSFYGYTAIPKDYSYVGRAIEAAGQMGAAYVGHRAEKKQMAELDKRVIEAQEAFKSDLTAAGVPTPQADRYANLYFTRYPGESSEDWGKRFYGTMLPKAQDFVYKKTEEHGYRQGAGAHMDSVSGGVPDERLVEARQRVDTIGARPSDALRYRQPVSPALAGNSLSLPESVPPSEMLRGNSQFGPAAGLGAQSPESPRLDTEDPGAIQGRIARQDPQYRIAEADARAAAGPATKEIAEMRERIAMKTKNKPLSHRDEVDMLFNRLAKGEISESFFTNRLNILKDYMSAAEKNALEDRKAAALIEAEQRKQAWQEQMFSEKLEAMKNIAETNIKGRQDVANTHANVALKNNATSNANRAAIAAMKEEGADSRNAANNTSREEIASKTQAAQTFRLAAQGKLDGIDTNTNEKETTSEDMARKNEMRTKARLKVEVQKIPSTELEKLKKDKRLKAIGQKDGEDSIAYYNKILSLWKRK